MQASLQQARPDRRSRGRVLRTWLWLCAIVFALQLAGASWHRHDVVEKMADCVSCHISAHLPAVTSGAAPALLAVFLAVAYSLERLHRTSAAVRPDFLTPRQQAPPRLS